MKNKKEIKDDFLLKLKKHTMYDVHPLVESYIMELLDEALEELSTILTLDYFDKNGIGEYFKRYFKNEIDSLKRDINIKTEVINKINDKISNNNCIFCKSSSVEFLKPSDRKGILKKCNDCKYEEYI